MASCPALLYTTRACVGARARKVLAVSFAQRPWVQAAFPQCRHFAGRSSRGGSHAVDTSAAIVEKTGKDDKATTTSAAQVQSSNTPAADSDGGSGTAAAATGNNTDTAAKSPAPALFALPLYRKPSFPSFYQIVQISEQEVLDFLFSLRKSGQGEYLGGFMTKELPSGVTETPPQFGGGQASPNAPSQAQGLRRDAGRVASANELEEVGTVLQVINLTQYPNISGGQVVVMPRNRVRRTRIVSAPSPNVALAAVAVDYLNEAAVPRGDETVKELHSDIIATMKELMKTSFLYKEQFEQVIRFYNLEDPLKVADLVAGMSLANRHELQAVLVEDDVMERLRKVRTIVKKDLEFSKLQSHVKSQVEEKVSKEQRRLMLMEQMKQISKELGIEKDEKTSLIQQFRDAVKDKDVPEEANKVIEHELGKLGSIEPSSSEYNVCRTYLEWLTVLPWGQFTVENKDITKAESILNEDHYGLEDVKERILEHIAVSFLSESARGRIMCLVGPPGVGKTSIGKSIARALDRKFYRFSVGGMHDVAEIRGHRRTYVGAMPGKLIQCLKVAQSSNPVVLIDEIDKLGNGFRGDPSSALLEVLDPEQNSSFRDHYLDVPVDLSQVLFICTANVTDSIPGPLLDRMEVIRIAGYVFEEKVAIANQFLIPQTEEQSGIGNDRLELKEEALHKMIADYARESGVRNLRKLLEKVSRKVALSLVRKPSEQQQKVGISLENLSQYIGQPLHLSDRLYTTTAPPGVVMGLAWTSMGGAMLYVEACGKLPRSHKERTSNSDEAANEDGTTSETISGGGNGGGLGSMQVTGQLGSVMNESSSVSLTYARLFARELDPANSFLDEARIHLNVPEGSVPKDGPSAGVTMASALISLTLNRSLLPNVAMTGELTLTGKVLKVGGIKEKVIAARREGVQMLLLPRQNEADYAELKDYLRVGITAHFVDHFDDIYKLAFDHSQVPPLPCLSRGLPIVTMSLPATTSQDTSSVPLPMGMPPTNAPASTPHAP